MFELFEPLCNYSNAPANKTLNNFKRHATETDNEAKEAARGSVCLRAQVRELICTEPSHICLSESGCLFTSVIGGREVAETEAGVRSSRPPIFRDEYFAEK